MVSEIGVLCFSSHSARDRSLADAAELTARVGLDGLEVTAHPPHLDPAAGAAISRREVEIGLADCLAIAIGPTLPFARHPA